MTDSADDPRMALLLVGAIVSGALFGAAIASGASGPGSTESDESPAIRSVEVQADYMLISVDSGQVRNLTVVFPNGTEMRPYTTRGGAQVFAVPEAGRQNIEGNTTFTLLARNDENEIIENRDVRVVAPGEGDNDLDLDD